MFGYKFKAKCKKGNFSCFHFTDPTIICPANQTEAIVTDRGQPTATVVWEAPTVNPDATEVAIDVEMCHPKSGSAFQMGRTKVVCEAKDVYVKENMCHFYVTVVGTYNFNIKLANSTLLCGH